MDEQADKKLKSAIRFFKMSVSDMPQTFAVVDKTDDPADLLQMAASTIIALELSLSAAKQMLDGLGLLMVEELRHPSKES